MPRRISMSDPQSSGGAADPSTGGASGEPIKDDKAFLALKAEKKALADKLAEANSKLEKLDADSKLKQEEVLKQQGEYKKLYEEEQKSKNELTLKLKAKEAKELALRKVDVVMQELGAPLVKPEYWDFVDLARIPVDETTNDIDRNVAKQVANDFILKFPELLAKKAGKVDNTAGASAKALSHEDWVKLPLAEKRLRLKDVKK